MNENKRFTLEMQYWKGNPQGRKLFDNLTGQDGMSVEELCNIASDLHSKCEELESVLKVYEDCLGKLEDENKELKEENNQLKQLLKCSREEANEYCEELMSIEASIKLYEDINKNLKQAIKESYEILSINVDVFSDKSIEHDIIAYKELQQLDNKDAYSIAKGIKGTIELLKRWL